MEFVSVINSERIPALQQDRIDLAASGMTRADNRRHLIGFSLAYLVSPHTVIIRKDSGITAVKQMAGKKLALVQGRERRRRAQGGGADAWRSCFFDTYALCFDALRDKQGRGLPGRRGAAVGLCAEERRAAGLHDDPGLRPAAHRRLRDQEGRAALHAIRRSTCCSTSRNPARPRKSSTPGSRR